MRPFLFLFDPESVHIFITSLFDNVSRVHPIRKLLSSIYSYPDGSLSINCFGVDFPNPIGLAAGFDKDGKHANSMSNLGFGFIEIGTVTPLPQKGNNRPRLFRLKADNALINRMGFNNAGVQELKHRLENQKRKFVLGINIGKNKTTERDKAVEDYLYCFNELHHLADYFVVNVSSPNTPDLRSLQDKEPLTELLKALKNANALKKSQKPILLKIAPDLNNDQLDDIIEIVLKLELHGIIATNTTIERSGLRTSKKKIVRIGNGGLSGKPLKKRSTEVIRYIHEKSNGQITIIGVGGIYNANDAKEKMEAGASLIQIYTGFIYQGPAIIKKILKGLSNVKN